MRKLNSHGITTIEIILCFVLVFMMILNIKTLTSIYMQDGRKIKIINIIRERRRLIILPLR